MEVKALKGDGAPEFIYRKGDILEVIRETEKYYIFEDFVFNEEYRRIKTNFTTIKEQNRMEIQKKVTCIKSNFKNLTEGNSYNVVAEMGDFYYISNDKSKKAKYGKRYFEDIKEPKKPVRKPTPIKEEPREAISKVVCKYPIKGSFSYNCSYDVIEEKGEDYVLIDDNNNREEALKIRFIEE